MHENYSFHELEKMNQDLPQWATITQVAQYLGVSRVAVRSAARRAFKSGEPWVRREKEEEGEKGMPPRLRIDTTHEHYLAHAQRWQQAVADEADEQAFSYAASINDWAHAARSNGHQYIPSSSLSRFPPYEEEPGLSSCPVLLQGLRDMGLQVFTNILAGEEGQNQWHWQWQDKRGQGCESAEAATVAALQSMFTSVLQASATNGPGSMAGSQPTRSRGWFS